MQCRPHATARRGFTMTEMLMALALFGLFMSFATTIFYGMNEAWRSAAAASTTATTFDAMTGVLRADAWGAAEISSPDPHTAKLTLPSSKTVVWHVAPDGSAVRTETTAKGTAERRWPASIHVRFSKDPTGDALVIRSGAAGANEDQMTLVSQVRLAVGTTR